MLGMPKFPVRTLSAADLHKTCPSQVGNQLSYFTWHGDDLVSPLNGITKILHFDFDGNDSNS